MDHVQNPILIDCFKFRPYQVEDSQRKIDGRMQKVIIGRGTFGQCDVPTANGRVYGRNLMLREIDRLRDQMHGRKVYGELDHPADGKTLMTRASHLITDAEVLPDGSVFGVLEILPETVNGKQAAAILAGGGVLGVSSRGFGTTTKDANGNDVVNDDYMLLTWDLVGDPANASAYPEFGVESRSPPPAFAGLGESREPKETTMDLEKLKKENPGLVEAIQAEARTSSTRALEEARQQALLQARKEKEDELKKMMPGLVAEVRSRLTKQLQSDPKTGAAVGLVEQLRPLMAPFIMEGDEAQTVKALQSKVTRLEESLRKANAEVLRISEERDEAIGIGKRALLKLHVENRLGDSGKGAHPCSVQLRNMLGRIDESMSVQGLDRRIEQVAGQLLEERTAQRERDLEVVRLRKLNEEKDLILKQAKDALLISGVAGYTAARCAKHPAGDKLAEAIMQRNPTSKAQVNSLFDELVENFRPSRTFTDVQNGLRNGNRLPTRRSAGPRGNANGDGQLRSLSEAGEQGASGNRQASQKRGDAQDSALTEGKIMGADITDIRRLAGIAG